MVNLCPGDLFLSLQTVANPDKMLHYVEFHLGLHYLQKYLFAGIQNEIR